MAANNDRRPSSTYVAEPLPRLGETGLLSQGVQAGRKALRTRHISGVEVRKKRPGGFK
jgi:hypothetical protein